MSKILFDIETAGQDFETLDEASKEYFLRFAKDEAEKEGIKRLVIDSLSTLLINAPIYSSCKSLSVTDVVGDNIQGLD